MKAKIAVPKVQKKVAMKKKESGNEKEESDS